MLKPNNDKNKISNNKSRVKHLFVLNAAKSELENV